MKTVGRVDRYLTIRVQVRIIAVVNTKPIKGLNVMDIKLYYSLKMLVNTLQPASHMLKILTDLLFLGLITGPQVELSTQDPFLHQKYKDQPTHI